MDRAYWDIEEREALDNRETQPTSVASDTQTTDGSSRRFLETGHTYRSEGGSTVFQHDEIQNDPSAMEEPRRVPAEVSSTISVNNHTTSSECLNPDTPHGRTGADKLGQYMVRHDCEHDFYADSGVDKEQGDERYWALGFSTMNRRLEGEEISLDLLCTTRCRDDAWEREL